MEKITRIINSKVVTVSTREGEVLDVYPVSRKTTVQKETIRSIKKLDRADIEVSIKEYSEQREMTLSNFIEYSKVVVEEVEADTEA